MYMYLYMCVSVPWQLGPSAEGATWPLLKGQLLKGQLGPAA
jgi:hypothetical protein